MKIKIINIVLLFLALPLISFSQQVTNIHFLQVGKQIHVYYDLEGEGKYDISVYCSEDDGESYGNALINITGAVGENQKPGNNKLIIWNVLKERDKLQGVILFKVVALNIMKVNLNNGKYIYDRSCIACHWKGVAGAPAIADRDRWIQVAMKGMDILYQQAIAGYQGDYGVMPAKGTCSDCSNQDIFDAVGYMVYKSGVVTEEPIDWKLIGNNYHNIFNASDFSSRNGIFTDERDKQIYKTVKIGKQIWMAENLAFKTSTGSWAYDNDESNVATYGRLYNWHAAVKACPSGWHLPSDDEWKQLEIELGMSQSDANHDGGRGTDEGEKLKSMNGWDKGGNGTNSSGFNALPGGYRSDSVLFVKLGATSVWWTSSEVLNERARSRVLFYDYGLVGTNIGNKSSSGSVRCIKY